MSVSHDCYWFSSIINIIISCTFFPTIINRDGSDETTENCISITCPRIAFRCMYGACVSGNAECNRRTECFGEKYKLI